MHSTVMICAMLMILHALSQAERAGAEDRIQHKDALIEQKEAKIRQKDTLIIQKDAEIRQKDVQLQQRDEKIQLLKSDLLLLRVQLQQQLDTDRAILSQEKREIQQPEEAKHTTTQHTLPVNY